MDQHCPCVQLTLAVATKLCGSFSPRGGPVLDSVLTASVLSLSGPVDPSFQALSGRLKLTVRRQTFNKKSLGSDRPGGEWVQGVGVIGHTEFEAIARKLGSTLNPDTQTLNF